MVSKTSSGISGVFVWASASVQPEHEPPSIQMTGSIFPDFSLASSASAILGAAVAESPSITARLPQYVRKSLREKPCATKRSASVGPCI